MVLKTDSIMKKSSVAKTFYLTIPSELASDSQFPFEDNDVVLITIYEGSLIIEKKGR